MVCYRLKTLFEDLFEEVVVVIEVVHAGWSIWLLIDRQNTFLFSMPKFPRIFPAVLLFPITWSLSPSPNGIGNPDLIPLNLILHLAIPFIPDNPSNLLISLHAMIGTRARALTYFMPFVEGRLDMDIVVMGFA